MLRLRAAVLCLRAAVVGRRARRFAVVQLRRLRRRRRPHLGLLLLLVRMRHPRSGEASGLPMAVRLGVHMLRLSGGLRATAAAEEVLHALEESARGLLLRVLLVPLSLDHGGAEGDHSYRKQDGTQHG